MKQASRRKYHYIYKITRTFDDRYYIGMHSTENIDDGYFGSGKLITRSIKKHGKDKHSKEILEYLPCRNTLKLREKELVNKDLLEDASCMNLKVGGDGGWPPGVGFKGFKNLEHQQKCASAGGKVGGLIAMNKLNANPEIRKKSFATRQANGSLATFGMLGKNHSDNARAKMSSSGMGEKNSSYGTCWVTNGIKPFKIKKEQLDEYIQNGYSRGRKKFG